MTFRILSIDGGGVRGFLAASILANLESYLNSSTGDRKPIGTRFDLIAGTSAGGLIALGLAYGRSAMEMRDLFLQMIPAVFGTGNRRGWLGRSKSPKYGSEKLEAVLHAFFQSSTLANLVVDVCIPSVSLIDAKPRLHKTDYMARNIGRLSESLVDVGMATTAAPTYLKSHSSKFSANLVDGGLAANNPSMIAIVDALQFERMSKRGAAIPSIGDVHLVSVGTGQPGPLPYNHKRLLDGGWVDWIVPIHEVVLLSQSQLVHHQAKFLIGERYLRIDPVLNVQVKLDDAESFRDLRNLADVDVASESYLKRFLS